MEYGIAACRGPWEESWADSSLRLQLRSSMPHTSHHLIKFVFTISRDSWYITYLCEPPVDVKALSIEDGLQVWQVAVGMENNVQ